MVFRLFVSFLAAVVLAVTGAQAEASGEIPDRAGQTWEFDFETGALWSVGGKASPLDYVILPQMVTVRGPAHLRRQWRGGELLLRPRFSVLVEPIVRGPEHHYIAAAASGVFEWWNAAADRALFLASGGGLGGMDSRGYDVSGGQGQDLNFNWFIFAGGRRRWGDARHLSLGLYYQHLSNTGLDDVNPGIDAVGPVMSFSWRF